MFATRVQRSLLEPRLDASYYDPAYIENEKYLCTFNNKTLDLLREDDTPIRYGVIKPRFVDSPVKMIRIQDFQEPFIDLRQSAEIDPSQAQEFKRSECHPGDLLVAIGGYPGRLGIVPSFPEGVSKANINQHIARVRVSSQEIDLYFTASFLLSEQGRKRLTRQVSGSVQAGINLEDLREIQIPLPHPDAQAYIGNKVRQAEALRARARELQQEAHQQVTRHNTFELEPSFQQCPRRIVSGDISEVSLDPSFVRTMRGHQLIPDRISLLELLDSCKCGDPIRSDERQAGPYPYYGASGPIDTLNDYNFEGDYLIVAQDGSIGCTNVAHGRFWANNHVWVLDIKPEYDLDAIAVYLQDYYPYWQGLTTGSVVPKVTSENLLRVHIPREIAIAKQEIGAPLRKAREFHSSAKPLVTASRFCVEALIERKVSEDELIAAQNDPSADRELMQRLTTDGFDESGSTPLFDDLDRLQELLDEANSSGGSDEV